MKLNILLFIGIIVVASCVKHTFKPHKREEHPVYSLQPAVDKVASGDASNMIDVDYGLPVTVSGLIVEYPLWANTPPGMWGPENPPQTQPNGAFGMIIAAPPGKTDKECPPIPAGSPLEKYGKSGDLKPLSSFPHNTLGSCLLGCNITEAKAGNDACRAGSMVGVNGENSLMSCYDLGQSFTGNAEIGTCGFNCTAMLPDYTYCTPDDIDQGKQCNIYCHDPQFQK